MLQKVLEHRTGPQVMTIYCFGPFRLDHDRLLLSIGDEPLPLGPKVVETVLALVERPGEVLGKAEILNRVWPEGFVEEANLAQNVYVIRKTLRAHWECNAIETVPRRGYRFVAPVTLETTVRRVPAVPQAAPAPLQAPAAPPRRLRFAGLAAAIAIALGISFAGFARPHAAEPATRGLSPDGARLYAMGKFYWNQRTRESNEKSLRYFKQVIQSDRHDARGYAGVASAYAIEGDYGFGPVSKGEAFARSQIYAKRALAVDPTSAEAHAALGLAEIDNSAVASGEAEFRRAIALDRQYAPAHQWYGMSLLRQGKGAQAFTELKEAVDLDPESVAATAWLAEAAYMARRYNDAVAYAQQTLDLSPRRLGAYTTMGLAYEALANYPAAIRAYEGYAHGCTSCAIAAAPYLAHAYAASHQYAQAERLLEVAQAGMAQRRVAPGEVITALVAMGRRDDALRVLRDARRTMFAPMLAIDPRMDPVRNDARFRRYIQGPA